MQEYLNNEEEKLRNLAGDTGNSFSVPSGYFDELPDKIADLINALPDFEKTSTVNPFAVPDNYFDKLKNEISDKVIAQKNNSFHWLKALLRPRLSIPLTLASFLFIAGLHFYKNNYVIPSADSHQLSADDLGNSLYIQSIDEDLFVDELAGQKEDVSDDSFEQYLIDNNVDLSQIESKL